MKYELYHKIKKFLIEEITSRQEKIAQLTSILEIDTKVSSTKDELRRSLQHDLAVELQEYNSIKQSLDRMSDYDTNIQKINTDEYLHNIKENINCLNEVISNLVIEIEKSKNVCYHDEEGNLITALSPEEQKIYNFNQSKLHDAAIQRNIIIKIKELLEESEENINESENKNSTEKQEKSN